MASRLRETIAPLYLLLCLILGGSAQGLWANMVLQLIGLVILAWAATTGSVRWVSPSGRALWLLAALGIALVLLQAIPLPPSLWTHLGGRGVLAEGYRILGDPIPWLPVSVTPYRSLNSLLGLIPPLALFAAMTGLGAYRPGWIAAALVVGTVLGIMLGALQVAAADPASSHWYFYGQSSFGLATGFFANANHMASLLVVTLPFLVALFASARGRSRQRASVTAVLAGGAGLLVVVGIALNRSLAAYGLTLPVLALSAALLFPPRSRWRGVAAVVAGLMLIAALGALAKSSVRGGSDAQTSVQSRQEMLSTSARALRDFLPWGSGLGSFQGVYQLYEDPTQVTNVYVVHAHDDYVELALELGAAGIVLMGAFLWWWSRRAWEAWRIDAGPYARAAAIASGAILVHSLVDFPLRTAAIAAVMASCLALMIERNRPGAQLKSDLRPTRHVVLR